MLVIWGRGNSVNVQKVVWVCEELSLPYERKDAGGPFGVVNTPEYRRLNPNGLIPTIVEDDFVLWESHAIVRYLGERHGAGTVYPNDPRTRGVADQWMDWTNTVMWPAIRPLFMGLIRTPPEKRDPKAIDESRDATIKALSIADAHLASRPFFAGDAFSMGDIPMGCTIWRWFNLPVDRPELPNISRWFESLTQRAAYKRIVMHPLT
jgi:glutathione S-transferase